MTGRVLSSQRHDVQLYAPSLGTLFNWPRLIANAIAFAGFLGFVAMLLSVGSGA